MSVRLSSVRQPMKTMNDFESFQKLIFPKLISFYWNDRNEDFEEILEFKKVPSLWLHIDESKLIWRLNLKIT